MRRLLAVGILGTMGLFACGGDSPTSPSSSTSPAPVATATPTPRPTPTFVGRWLVANSGINREHPLWGWAVEIQSHNVTTGEVRGLSYLGSHGFPGALRGTVRGTHVDWQTDYGDGDTENGSMDLTRYSNGDFLEGQVTFELPTIRVKVTFSGAALKKE